MAVLTILKFWEKSWYMKNWLLTVPLAKLKQRYKENELLKKKYFVVKNKQKNNISLTSAESLIRLKFNNIIW